MNTSETEINFHYKTDFILKNESSYRSWINRVIESEEAECGSISYIFSNDEYLHEINMQYLNHDTFTDIITFDYTEGINISGDIFISIERVQENAKIYGPDFQTELKRVMSHGVLHLLGYKDKKVEEKEFMRKKEDEKIAMFHVEQNK